MHNVVTFVPRRSRESELWDAYLLAIQQVHQNLPQMDVSDLRRVVTSYDAYVAEMTRGAV